MSKTLVKANKTNKAGRPQALPTANDLKQFAKKYTPNEWSRICGYQDFLDIVGYDLFGAGIMAEMILLGKYDKTKFERKAHFARKRNKQ